MGHAETLQRSLHDAEQIAEVAFRKWKALPGGSKGKYWFTCWHEAQQDIVRLTRALRLQGSEPATLDQELSDLLNP